MTLLRKAEYHTFGGADASYLYLVPSAAVVRLDDTAAAVLDAVGEGAKEFSDVSVALEGRWDAAQIRSAVQELVTVRALNMVAVAAPPPAATVPLAPRGPSPARRRVPLTTLVLNVTSKCNLSCGYCYEYGEDKLSEAAKKPRFMNEETARQSVDFMFAESGESKVVHLTFFGGETLLNFRMLKTALSYAQERGRELGKEVDVSLTTNATLLREEIVDWIVANDVGVTVSIDGAREQQDKHRVFANGMGSYDIIRPNIENLLAKHRRRPVGARVTLTGQNLDVTAIYKHLAEEIGFPSVGFAPVTTSWQREYAIEDEGFTFMLRQFQALAHDYVAAALDGRHHAFSNVADTLHEIHKGMSKAYPCGAGMGLMGVATDGDVALCHRFAGSDAHTIGSVTRGVDLDRQEAFFDRHHIDAKTDCSKCWARPLCAGGCYHEAHTRYGSTEAPNLHYCEWIRAWTHTCLEAYGTLAARKPEFLAQFS
ncbi:MAG TPA: quinohemoprotein amine dehydrogenase maturation protein [Gemmatimonas sp.]|nr:quinohemoprotein amine dehydrogenase maturation protein [Gemmatimonas sp.]